MFAKFFKPKWQHTKADVRVRAIQRMNAEDSEHAKILSQLAIQDQSPAVRQAAVEKIATPDLLSRICENDGDQEIRRCASDRICRLILDTQSTTHSQRLASIEHLTDDNMLTHIVLHSTEPAAQQAALARISDQLCLRTVVLNAANNRLRTLAAEQLTQAELLEQLNKETRSKDKTVNRIIREKLRHLRDTEKQAARAYQRQLELIDSLTHLSNSDHCTQYAARLEGLCQEWSKLDSAADLQQQADTLIARCTAVVQRQQQRAEAAALLQQQQDARHAQQTATLNRLGELINRYEGALSDSAALSDAVIASFNNEWQTLLQNWQDNLQVNGAATAELHAAYHALEHRYARLSDTARVYCMQQEALSALLQHAPANLTAKQLANTGKRIDRLLAQISWPTDIPAPDLLRQLRQLHSQVSEQQAQQSTRIQAKNEQLDTLLAQLAANIEAGEIKAANRCDQHATELLTCLNGDAAKNLQQRYKLLHAELAELRDWQGYAVTPKKEQLCEVMESLIDSDLAAPHLAKRIHQLQQEWRELDATDPFHSHALWKRFKAASDSAYQPCEQHFAEQKQLRADNLQQRRQLCTQLQQFIADTDWTAPDWPQVELISRTAKQQWRSYAPVDRTPGKEIQSSFNSLLKQLDGQLKTHRQHNAEAKHALLDQATALGQANDLQTTVEQVKMLQRQWKEIGSTFHSVERTLWPQFREACNQIFAQLKQHQSNHAKQPDPQQLLQLCEQLENVQSAPTPLQQMIELLHSAEQAYAEFDSTAQLPSQLKQRFSKACEFIRQQQIRFDNLIHSDHFQALQRKVTLCEHLEAMLLSGVIEEDKLLQVQHSWHQGLQPTEPYAAMIEQRYQTTLLLLEQEEAVPTVMSESEQLLRQLCIRLEIALNQPSPEEDQALRLEYQMQRLQQAIEQRSQAPLPVDLKTLELEWMCIPFSHQHEALYPRFHDTLKQAL